MRLYTDQPIGTVPRARRARREASEPELRLLRRLREQLGEDKWRHQTPIGPFRVDLLCFAERLVIEIDGDTHADSAQYDAERTRYLEREGFRVLRFTNAEVMQNLDGVVAQISLSLWEREGAHRVSDGKGEDRTGLSSPFRACGAPSLSQRERE